ncbi:MAG: hypothetical protein KF817_02530 [Phycisphaeraceae bacterium]|nr:hypothetical protein [Phycisphaeraceae bacterium]
MSRSAAHFATAGRRRITAANRHGLDYAAEASAFPVVPGGIVDVHTHVNGVDAARIFRRVCDLYGITHVCSMTRLEDAPQVTAAMEGRLTLIAVPDYWRTDDRSYHLGPGFLPRIEAYAALGAPLVKFWVAPRARDLARDAGDPDLARLDAPSRLEAMRLGAALGMGFMVHVGDPDTWFRTRYADPTLYGTKADQYLPLRRVLDRFEGPWIAAHLGGWPEDLHFLSGLLDAHPNLALDSSATKWMVRELSRHDRSALIDFLTRYRGRILFGSDIVTTDEHLSSAADETVMTAKAGAPEEAFDLYASRYWALRTLFETDWSGASPIADPDLAMEDPDRFTPDDAPPLQGKALPADLLRALYGDAARAWMASIRAGCPASQDTTPRNAPRAVT